MTDHDLVVAFNLRRSINSAAIDKIKTIIKVGILSRLTERIASNITIINPVTVPNLNDERVWFQPGNAWARKYANKYVTKKVKPKMVKNSDK